MKQVIPVVGLALAFNAPVSLAQSGAPVTFNTYARVAVDATGHPTSVDIDDAALPAAITERLSDRIRKLPFSPPERDGRGGNAVTWVQVAACAVPMDDGNFRLGMDVLGNGPKPATGRTVLLDVPNQALVAGDGGAFLMTVQVDADGTARLLDLDQSEGSRQHFRLWRRALQDYIAKLRYEPERLAGSPVASRIRMNMSVGISNDGFDEHMRKLRETMLARAVLSRECQAAAGNSPATTVALDSPVKFAPGG